MDSTSNLQRSEVRKKRKLLKTQVTEITAQTSEAEVMQLAERLIDFYWNEEARSGHLVSNLHKKLIELGSEHFASDLRCLVEKCTVWEISEQKARTRSEQAITAAKASWQERKKQLLESEVGACVREPSVELATARRVEQLEAENKHLRRTLKQCDEIYFSRLDKILTDFSAKMNYGLYLRIKNELSILKTTGIASSLGSCGRTDKFDKFARKAK